MPWRRILQGEANDTVVMCSSVLGVSIVPLFTIW